MEAVRRENGAKIVVVDPNVSGTAAKADAHFAPKPAFDGIMAMAMINHIIENGLYNEAFVRDRTIANGGDTMDMPRGDFPKVQLVYHTVACQHCSEPACEAVCPTGATHKDEATGIVLVDENVCIGCDSCIAACPLLGRFGRPRVGCMQGHGRPRDRAAAHREGYRAQRVLPGIGERWPAMGDDLPI